MSLNAFGRRVPVNVFFVPFVLDHLKITTIFLLLLLASAVIFPSDVIAYCSAVGADATRVNSVSLPVDVSFR
ncbi:hypothetical protein D3C75_1274590 [compost metagenome]